jgi:hypothetical protein
VWFRRGRLFMVSPDSLATACPLSGRNSTYRPVQISETTSLRALAPLNQITRRLVSQLGVCPSAFALSSDVKNSSLAFQFKPAWINKASFHNVV